jgi:hypothetical protein
MNLIREELARIVSRFGPEVSPHEVPDTLVANYVSGLRTGRWFLKTPRLEDHCLVIRAIAGINAVISAQTDEELDEAGRVLLGAVMQAMGTHSEQIACEWSDNKVRIILLGRGQPSSTLVLGAVRLD